MKRMLFVSRPKQKIQLRPFSSARSTLEHFCQKLPSVFSVERSSLTATRIIARQHFVRSSVDLFDLLSHQYDLPAQQIYLASKFYSESSEVSQTFTAKGFQVFHDQNTAF